MNFYTRELEPMVCSWLPPTMPQEMDIKMRMTHVDGAFQFYGHNKNHRHFIRSMKAYYDVTYKFEDHPENSKKEWRLGEPCVAKMGSHWYRAKVIETDHYSNEVGVIFVDLGNVQKVNCEDLRIAREFDSLVCITFIHVIDKIL